MSAPRVLIVEGDLAEAQILEDAIFEIPERQSPGAGLSRQHWWNARIVHARTLAGARAALADRQADLILLNPLLPDCEGIDTFRFVRVQSPDLPVVLILDEGSDEQIGQMALREGAQDYLLKTRCDWESLSHAMDAALERSRLMRALWKSFLADPLTGLPNRTGFVYLAEILQTACNRTQSPLRMIVADLERKSSDEEVEQAAEILRSCVNAGDLTGRLGPAEFGVLSTELDAAELATRVTTHGTQAPRFRWSDCMEQNPLVGSFESIDKIIANAELLLPDRDPSYAVRAAVAGRPLH